MHIRFNIVPPLLVFSKTLFRAKLGTDKIAKLGGQNIRFGLDMHSLFSLARYVSGSALQDCPRRSTSFIECHHTWI